MSGEKEPSEKPRYERPEEVMRWAFDVHKDADALLHSRLQGFLTFNALLAGGFFLSVREQADHWVTNMVAFLPCATGLAISHHFPKAVARIIAGIIKIKETWLIHDEVYRAYYYGNSNVTPDGKVTLTYSFALNAPKIVFWFWVMASTVVPLKLIFYAFGISA